MEAVSALGPTHCNSDCWLEQIKNTFDNADSDRKSRDVAEFLATNPALYYRERDESSKTL